MVYHHAKFGYKRFNHSEDTAQKNVNWNSEPMLDNDSHPITSQETPAYDVCLFESHISITWAFDVTFNLKIFILHDTQAYDDTSPCQVGFKSFSGSEDTVQTNTNWNFEPLR